MRRTIFISYRRKDCAGMAGRLHDRLAKAFSRKALFMDVEAIAPGVDFVRMLDEQVGACRVFLALIGRNWLNATNDAGQRCLDDPGDFVRIEIAFALRRGIPLIPILVDGAVMPKPSELPDDLKPLAARNAIDLRHTSFGVDAEIIVKALKKETGSRIAIAAAAAAAFAVACALIGYWQFARSTTSDPAEVMSTQRAPACIETLIGSERRCLPQGSAFKDCGDCPDMVVIPAGAFLMGSPDTEIGRFDAEDPLHKVTIPKPIAIGKLAVTLREFELFVREQHYDMSGPCTAPEAGLWLERPNRSYRDPGFAQEPTHPAVCVSWDDAQAFVAWLSAKAGVRYRLPSESEWEYAARAGTRTAFWWGNNITVAQANFDGSQPYRGSAPGPSRQATVAADAFDPNPWGLYNVHGNAWEWVEDCWHKDYIGAPDNGAPWRTGECDKRIRRGGSWYSLPIDVRAATRHSFAPGDRVAITGFRVARDLAP